MHEPIAQAPTPATVSITLAEAIEAVRDLDEYVVSLDRIRSRIAFGGHSPEILLDYIIDRNVFQRLAHLRRVVCDAVAEVVGEEMVEEIAESAYAYTDKPT